MSTQIQAAQAALSNPAVQQLTSRLLGGVLSGGSVAGTQQAAPTLQTQGASFAGLLQTAVQSVMQLTFGAPQVALAQPSSPAPCAPASSTSSTPTSAAELAKKQELLQRVIKDILSGKDLKTSSYTAEEQKLIQRVREFLDQYPSLKQYAEGADTDKLAAELARVFQAVGI
ncbi:MAG TPA: hypothetical protein PLA90_05025 [Candidatus Sumerlaeota bacterium]|nr:hypothetical protein [Candidatus Sumerlaeota bacterium]HPS00885.1 hypothetical protein [Candidatus Sumerlaeota bacterium]